MKRAYNELFKSSPVFNDFHGINFSSIVINSSEITHLLVIKLSLHYRVHTWLIATYILTGYIASLTSLSIAP